ncbi:MAG: PDZ domain-containing protein [Planctomycetota bacterium]
MSAAAVFGGLPRQSAVHRAASCLLLALAAGAASAQDDGARRPGFLGVQMAPWTVPDADPPQSLVAVTGVVPGSGAAAAGILAGDVIAAVDTQSTAAPPAEVLQRFSSLIRARGAGETLALTIRRPTLSVHAFSDGEEVQPPEDATGPNASRILPDLAELLEAHPDGRLEVRAERTLPEKVFEVTLGERPESLAPALPPNAELRPDLEVRGDSPRGALVRAAAERVPGALADVRQRLEQNEAVDDAFRLKTVRYLHREPVRLGDATRTLARTLVVDCMEQPSPAGAVLAQLQLELDVAPVTSAVPARPARGADAASYARYAAACALLARQRVERALRELSATEREALADALPHLADAFAEHIYLHEDADLRRRARNLAALPLLAKVDRGAMLDALSAFAAFSEPEFLMQLRLDLLAQEERGDYYRFNVPATTGRVLADLVLPELGNQRVIVGSSDPNVYRLDAAIVIDLGGDDHYHQPVGGARPDRPVALCVDLDGHDRYQATVPFAQGAGFMGVGLLVDAAGDDVYTSNRTFAQGAGLAGAGMLIDLAGDDRYRAPTYAQGACLAQGAGVLIDDDGRDLVSGGLYVQGFAGPGAFGLLLARGGDDRYEATGSEPCGYGDAGTFRGMSQGAAIGFRNLASGGIALLVDHYGRDVYEAGNFSQGGGYYYGWGSLVDLGETRDLYEGSRYAQGFAAHSALGSLWDDGGDDAYQSFVGASQGAAWDLSVTAFMDDWGNDRYLGGPAFSYGAAAHNGFALFLDGAGEDTYVAAPGRVGPNDYHGGQSVAVVLDLGGELDRYPEGSGLGDDRGQVREGQSVVVDFPATDPREAQQQLETLLGP